MFPASVQFSSAGYGLVGFVALYLFVEGDSLSNDTGDWPEYLRSKSNYLRHLIYVNAATAGETAATMVAQFASQIAAASPGTGKRMFFLLAGTNDCTGTADSAATITANLNTIWADARAAGMTVVAFTIPPSTSCAGARETVRTTVNASTLASASLWDYVVDVSAMYPDPSNAANYSDGTHFTASAADAIATWINTNIVP